MSEDGFYSAVADRERAGWVIVRARREEDLRRLRMPGGRRRIARTPKADYPFRVRLLRTDWAIAVRNMAMAIDYPNFKATVADDPARARAYHDVWERLMDLEL